MSKQEPFCISCDDKTDYSVKEVLGGFLAAYCNNCGNEIYVAEINDFNARLSAIRREKALTLMEKGKKNADNN